MVTEDDTKNENQEISNFGNLDCALKGVIGDYRVRLHDKWEVALDWNSDMESLLLINDHHAIGVLIDSMIGDMLVDAKYNVHTTILFQLGKQVTEVFLQSYYPLFFASLHLH